MGNLQSNPSSSTHTTDKKHEVFLNFRGIDTRAGFTNNLYEALRAKSIETFMDDHGIPKGDEIGPELLKAIRDSMISVVIFSKEYASSKWCLRELVEIMKCMKSGQIVIPVFYKVTVSDVGDLEGSFMNGFDKLKKRFDEKLEKEQLDSADVEKRKKVFYDETQQWRRALEDASHVKGHHSYENGYESEVIAKIVIDIWEKLVKAYKLYPCDFEGHFGFKEKLKQVKSLLSLDNTDDVRIIGIWGMGGIGKTTIADAIFHQISEDEYGKCFIGNVRQRLEKCEAVTTLQQEILSAVLNNKKIKLDGVTLPQHIKDRLCEKKVFIVLDDVDNFLKLHNLARGLDQLGRGSRIIITTRSRDILYNCGVNDNYIYGVKGLSDQEALQLFHKHAFKLSHPTIEDLVALSPIHEILRVIDGNPLCLIVAGSSLLKLENLKNWQSALSRLKKNPEIIEVLKISYNGLQEEERDIFLDIACLFVGEHKDYVVEILDNCSSLLDVLSDRSLITISNNMTIQMHDLLQEMGREIVRKEDRYNPDKRSRLWTQEDVLDTLKNCNGTNEIRGLFLNMSQMNEEHLNSQAFKKMRNLLFLKFYDSSFNSFLYFRPMVYHSKVRFSEGISDLTNKLRSFNWLGYPLRALPSNFFPNSLIELKLKYSNIEEIWEKKTHAPKLKWIILKGCPYLIQVLELLDAPLLEKIDIESCQSLSFLASPNEFQSLKSLHLSFCDNLTWIPNLDAPLLEKIDIQCCKKLLGFPSPTHPFNNLRELNLGGCHNLQSFPNEIHFPSLVSLDLDGCSSLARISDVLDAPLIETINLDYCDSLLDFPRPAQHFNKLRKISLDFCTSLLYFPRPAQYFSELRETNLDDCSSLLYFPTPFQHFPSDNIHFPSLKCLDLSGCIKLTEFPCISGNIERLYMMETAIHEVPSLIENLPKLVALDLEECRRLKHISSSISKLKALRELNLRECSALECFPEISDTMESLEILDLSGTAIKGLHHSIENLSLLEELRLRKCKNLDEGPTSIENLTELFELDLAECASLKRISFNICKLKALTNLDLSNCSALECFPEISDEMGLICLDLSGTAIKELHHSIENLTELGSLRLAGCTSLKHISFSICKLKALTCLNLSDCSALECFPEISDTMGSLKLLYLNGTSIKGLHHSIKNLSGLQLLALNECRNLEMIPNSIYNLTSLEYLDLSNCSKLENLFGNSVTDLSNCGLSKCELWFVNCHNLNKTAVINNMELQINHHRDMTSKGCGTQAVNLKFFCPGSEVPRWFKHQIGSSINIQMSGHDGVNGHLSGLAACAVIKFKDGYDFGFLDLDISYQHRCHCKDLSPWTNFIEPASMKLPATDQQTLNDSDHVALWYFDASVLELCECECQNYLFEFVLSGSPYCSVKYCGVCPIYEKHNITLPSIANETCGAADQDFGETSVKKQGKVRKFSEKAETSGRSNEDVIEPHPKKTCRVDD